MRSFDILAEYKISYIKWDHNRDLMTPAPPRTPARCTRPDAGLLPLVDEIKAAHPGLEIETCSSGGGRVDLGVLERTDRVWVSDCIDPLERQQNEPWTAQLLPPELLAHILPRRVRIPRAQT
jgi:alpha-galactosidase